jgi:hypothetical protein
VSAEETVNTIISNALANTDQALEKAIAYSDAAQTAASTVLVGLPPIHTPSRVDVDVPEFDPNVDLAGEFNAAFNNAVSDFEPDFAAEVQRFLDQWFPSFAGCLQTSVDNWICNMITAPSSGITTAVENQMWERSRARELLENTRAKNELAAQWSSRGWSMPAGMMAQQTMMLDQVAGSQISTHSRDTAIKMAEIAVENVRFAVQQGAQLRLGIMGALVDYLRAFMTPWELAIQKASAVVDAKSRLWQSSTAYYSALIAAEELQLKYDQLMIDRGLGANKLTVDQVIGTVSNRVNAAVAAAEAMANTASAALSAQVSLAKVGSETITGNQ